MGVLKACKPRQEVLKGDLSDAIFAADFGDLVAGDAPRVYKDAKTFFQNTHPAQQLCKVVQTVFDRLADPKEPGATIRLSTGFGGGKTHTLMALWHLAKNISDASMGTELLPAAGRPDAVTVAGIDAGKAGVPDFAVHGNRRTQSLHGELFFALGGPKGIQLLGAADGPEASPNESQIEKVFPKGPVLILLDEIVIYMAKLSERGQKNLLGFLNSLASVVAKQPQSILIVTDPAGQVAYAAQAAKIEKALAEKVGKELEDMFGRKVSDFDPIGKEGARVIVRRLFEKVDQAAAQAASKTYHELFKRVSQEQPGLLPVSAAGADYAKRIVECYPFHPRLLQTAEERLGALQDFQRSRGVLRLFARIVRDVWDRKEDYELISGGDIDWSSQRIQADLLNRLNKEPFAAAISADVTGHAGELDGGAGRGVHSRVASALLLESIPLQPNSGLDPAECTLAVLRPEEAGPEPSEALERLVGTCWHTYPMASGRGWQFRFEPNVLKQIEERRAKVSLEDAQSKLFSEVQGYFAGPAFKLAAWPESAKQVPDSATLQLALCEDADLAKGVCAYSDDSDPQNLMPRQFQNAIFAVAPTAAALNDAVVNAQRLIAAEEIERDSRGDSAKLVRDQLKRIKPELEKQFRLRAYRAFDKAVFAGGSVFTLDEQYQVPDEQVLQRPQGQQCLRKFLDANKLIYQSGDGLEVNRFLKNVLAGATPTADSPEVYTAKAVHERFLSAPDLRLVPDGGVVRQTILRAVSEGKAVVRLEDGRAYDAKGCVEGLEGKRQRTSATLPSLALDDTVLITPAKTDAATAWLRVDEPEKEDKKKEKKLEPPPPPPSCVEATRWEKVLEYAEKRPLLELHLLASAPADASALSGLAQPLGAEKISLSVTVEGDLKGGGTARFLMEGVKLNHPTRPLDVARVLFTALEEGASYKADLTLDFGTEGRSDLASQLKKLADEAPEGVRPQADFDKPLGGNE